MKLHRLAPADLKAVATLHRAAFPRAAISRLGATAARRYYESLLSGPHETVGVGAFENGRLTGFSFVGVRHSAEIFFVRQHAWFLGWRLASHPWLLLEPFILSRIASGLRMLWPAPNRPPPNAGPPSRESSGRSYGIQYLAVDPPWQGRGVGRQLLAASEEMASRQGCAEIHLSVYLDNAKAIGLYERMGWQKRTPEGVWQGFMYKRLTRPDGR
jgi:ribosomal protein S18 acetylase RimI-like enzyme